MARHRSRSVDYLVYLAARGVVSLAQMLTIEQSYAFARFLAKVLYRIDVRHRNVGLENLRHAFGELYPASEHDRIVRRVYEHFCMMLMEILHIPRMMHLTNWRERITLVGHEPILDRLMTGGP